ncbi:MAG: GGDEF domain-containing protein [Spirochaetes bacterium]|nr:GGDEF domain-containing protein [Spirochaetota bacterium]
MKKYEKIIYVVNDSLEQYEKIFQIENIEYDYRIGRLDSLESEVKRINKEIVREQLLLVIKKSVLTDDNLIKALEYFSGGYKFTLPYILYIEDEDIPQNEKEMIDKGGNYFFLISKILYKNDINILRDYFISYINLIFKNLVTTERLNYYIVDSFQTIIDSTLVNIQKAKIEILNKEIIEISKIDYLTNVLNRRAFFEALEVEKKRAIRNFVRLQDEKGIELEDSIDFHHKLEGGIEDHFGRFTCVLLDIDFFKRINDTHGHLVGDEVLKKIGEVLTSKVIFRENDIVARYGGEEFIVILPETNSKHAFVPAERLREFIKKIDFFDGRKTKFNITISVGISEFSMHDKSNEDLIKRADEALYYAKENGRDQVVIYEEVYKEGKK